MISPRVSGVSGVAQHVSKLIEKLRDVGFDVDYISVENTPHIPIRKFYNPSFAITSTLKVLLRRLMDVRYDIAHGHNLPTWFPVRFSNSAIKILTLHGIYSKQIGILHGSFIGFLSSFIEKFVVGKLDMLTCISKETYKYYRELGFKVRYIPNAIDFRDLPNKDEYIRLYDRQVIYAGRLSKDKGIDILLSSAKYIDKNIHVLILGSGPLVRLVKSVCDRYDNLHYLGYKPRYECLKYIAGSDALILPSRVEAIPTVVLEAMALKTLVISFRIPSILDILSDEMGILIDSFNPLKLAEAINNYTSYDIDSYIERAFKQICRFYNWDVVFKQYLELYNSLINGML